MRHFLHIRAIYVIFLMISNCVGLAGDPDLYIGCDLAPTFDADGYPSNLYRHNIRHSSSSSSSASGADVVYIATGDEHCSAGVYYVV